MCVALQESLGVGGDVSYTCETAGHFFLYQVMSRWEKYSSQVKFMADKVRWPVGCGWPGFHRATKCCHFPLSAGRTDGHC